VGYTWCQKTRQEKNRRGSINITQSLLHSQDGTVFYVNRFQEPIFFGPNEADAAIRQSSNKFGEKAEIKILSRQRGLPEGRLATWGKVALEPLDRDSLNTVAAGKSPKIGYLVDFIGDFARSAKEGLPIYRVSGGAGFFWVASFDQKGRGTLRLTAVDPSPTSSDPPPNEPPTSNDQTTLAKPEIALSPTTGSQTSSPTTDVDRQAEKPPAKPDAGITPSETASRTQVANNEIERLSAEGAKLNAVVRQLESEKAGAESKAHKMEFLAYGSGVIALLAIVASVLFVSRKKVVTVEPQKTASEAKLSDLTGRSPETKPPADTPSTKPSDRNSASLEISSKARHGSRRNDRDERARGTSLPIEMLQKND
jgi:hypothetical protein